MMLKGAFTNDRFWIKGLVFTFLTIFGLLIGVLIAGVFFSNQTDLNSLRLAQFVLSLTSFAFPAFVTAFLLHDQNTNYLRINTFPSTEFIFLTILSVVLVAPFINLTASWNEQLSLPESFSKIEALMRTMQQMADDLTMRLLGGTSILDFLANILFLALIPAITEELFFRGALQRLLEEKLGKNWSVWVVAIIFSAYHMQFFGFVPRLLLGALLGYLLVWSNSLYLPIIAHFTNNASMVILSFLSAKKLISFNIDAIGTEDQWWIGVISLGLVLPILLFMAKYANRTNREQ